MAKRELDKGTHYESRKTEQRSYFLPAGLGDAFKTFNNGNASTGARGAFVAWMALDEFSDVRERAINAAQNMKLPDAVECVKKLLIDAVGQKALRDWSKSLPEAERVKLLARALSARARP